MPVTTQHQFIDLYPVKTTDRRLILGTMHPPRVDDFLIQFFYGNRGSFWQRLAEAFPEKDFSNLSQILERLSDHNVWVSDIVRSCIHKNGDASDKNLVEIVYDDRQIRESVMCSNIDEMFFTSEYAFVLFKTAFGIRLAFDRLSRKGSIPSKYFGKCIKYTVLYSPSLDASKGIAKGRQYKAWLASFSSVPVTPTIQYRVENYRNSLSFFAK